MREDFYDTRSPTPSRELQQHKWSCSGSSLSGRVIASVADEQQGVCQTSEIHLNADTLHSTNRGLSRNTTDADATEVCHEADTEQTVSMYFARRSRDPADAPAAGGPGDRVTPSTSLGAALEAFILEHEYCGELDGRSKATVG